MTSIATQSVAADAPPPSRARGNLRRLVRSPLGITALSLVAVLILVAILAPLLWGSAASAYHPDAINQRPSGAHLAGTDSGGRDILLRVLVATRLSLLLTLAATAIAVVLGVALGSIPSLGGRRTQRAVANVVSTAVAFPSLLLAIFVATVVGVGASGAVFALGVAGAPWFARLTQNLAASVSRRDFVSAARILGVSRVRILLRHILPNISEPLAINTTIAAGANLLAFSGLSYLGLGVQGPSYDWGRLLLEGVNAIYVNPAAALAPGVAIVLAGLALSLAGELAAQSLGRRTRGRAGGRPRPTPSVVRSDRSADIDASGQPLLDVRGLTVTIASDERLVTAVADVDLAVVGGESVGIVGESGAGKSLTALSIARLVEAPVEVTASRLRFAGAELLGAGPAQVRERISDGMAVVFQDPMSSLNPLMRVGSQLSETAVTHERLSRSAAWTRAVDRLRQVRIPAPERRARQLPHEFSGGMRQRAMIAMGLMGRPTLIIADEPTTALDVTVQRDVLALIAETRERTGCALLLISHDIAVIAQMCDRILVMYAGRVVEELATDQLHTGASHPYTRDLVAALPTMTTARDRPLATIAGQPPAPDAVVTGCAYAPRCSAATDLCRRERPTLQAAPAGRVACWHPVGSVAALPTTTITTTGTVPS